MDKTSTVSENPEIEDHSRDEMDDIILDTNQQSSRIISEEIPKPIPVQASSLTLTSKSGKDKSGAWSPETLLTHLTTWGQVASMSIKAQHKYCTVRLKIAFNDFTLQAFDGGKWCHQLHNLEVHWFPER
ncbi:hypothetical protein RclHR1_06240004 [Rhizophagus clarus]|uniref:Uncharacterized protein n=1 Tax=Rhizophagus clarus TaxID=94130 RepID=A0A2Z6RQU7_9GLOM|nr:hypothetical protein RclHR1_06240004 [Rhizophagus clarus]GES89991.1 hypothetical protein GLOIN_2v1700277 [Rhizophagus clarus]